MDFRSHRDKLAKISGGSPIILTAHDAVQQSGDMAAPFLQDACFWWLTGIEEPGWKVIIESSRHRTTLVRPTKSEVEKIFGGESMDEDIIKTSSADEVIDEKEFELRLREIAKHHTLCYSVYDKTSYDFVHNPAQRELHGQLTRIFSSVEDCRQQIHALRAIKSEAEIAAIKRAVSLTVKAFKYIRENLSTYKHEYEIEADFWHAFRGADAKHAYEPIVAAGKNAVTLHYVANKDPIRSKDTVLIDVGARVGGYAADITRTYAVNPSKRQIEIHAAVEKAHRRIIGLLGPDLLVSEYIKRVDEIMKDALQEVGLLDDRSDESTYRRYFPHAISHGLGVDVHDSLGGPRYFQPGMVLTVEPGIYIAEENIGVRIEDDILITASGVINLSRQLSTAL